MAAILPSFTFWKGFQMKNLGMECNSGIYDIKVYCGDKWLLTCAVAELATTLFAKVDKYCKTLAKFCEAILKV